MMVERLEHEGTLPSSSDLLKILVNTYYKIIFKSSLYKSNSL